ncbi:minor capsid protein (plasmid) [Halobacillus litoralis]|uniref:phage head morphogenesis protein n=1 Tax=Halobacillus litoralis TaxID=45668 RepID=UPI001CFEA3E7|nr:minor capsid protein [Halobacillus litoralis]WLR49584.1 minor capsid protein [Halobacillus litoralis]
MDGNENEFVDLMLRHVLDPNYLNNLINSPTDKNYRKWNENTKKIFEYFFYKTFLAGMNDAGEEIQKQASFFEGYAEDDPQIEVSSIEEQIPEEALSWYESYAIYLTMVFEQDVLNEVQGKVREYLEKGINVRDIPKLLAESEKLEKFTKNRLNTIARTESTKAYNSGRVAEYHNSRIVEAVQYSAILDNRTTTFCRGLNGKIMEKSSYLVALYQPPNHFNCRSLLVPITKYDEWEESDFTGVEKPQDGFDNPAWKPLKPLN